MQHLPRTLAFGVAVGLALFGYPAASQGVQSLTAVGAVTLTGGTYSDVTVTAVTGASSVSNTIIQGTLTFANVNGATITVTGSTIANVFIGNSSDNSAAGDVAGATTEISLSATTVSGRFDVGRLRQIKLFSLKSSTVKGLATADHGAAAYSEIDRLVLQSSTLGNSEDRSDDGIRGFVTRVGTSATVTSCSGTNKFGVDVVSQYGAAAATVSFTGNSNIGLHVGAVSSTTVSGCSFTRIGATFSVSSAVTASQPKLAFTGNTLPGGSGLVIDQNYDDLTVSGSTIPLGLRWAVGRTVNAVTVTGCSFTRASSDAARTPLAAIEMPGTTAVGAKTISIGGNSFSLHHSVSSTATFPVDLNVVDATVVMTSNGVAVKQAAVAPAHLFRFTLTRSTVAVRETTVDKLAGIAGPLFVATAPTGPSSMNVTCVKEVATPVTDSTVVIGAAPAAWIGFDATCPVTPAPASAVGISAALLLASAAALLL